jgi:hypothetical protein
MILPYDANRAGWNFRKGQVQAMMSAIVDKLSKAEHQSLEVWFADILTPWSQQSTGNIRPPEPPRW